MAFKTPAASFRAKAHALHSSLRSFSQLLYLLKAHALSHKLYTCDQKKNR